MPKEIQVRRYQEGDEVQIVSLLEEVFDGWSKLDIDCAPVDYWRWKFQSGEEESFVTVAEDNGRVVGCHHAYQVNIKIRDIMEPCTSTCDFAVHPEYRRMGISKLMGYEFSRPWRKEAGMTLDYFIVGNPVLVKSFSKTRPRFPVRLVNLTWIMDVDQQFEKYPMRYGWFLKNGFKLLSHLNRLRTKRFSTKEITVVDTNQFPPEMDNMWEEIREKYDFISERTQKSLNRKYCDPRNKASKIMIARKDKQVLGYCVLRINGYNDEYPVGYIVDLVALPDRLDVAKSLIAKGLEFFKENNVNIVNYQIPEMHPYVNVFKRIGFVDSRVRLHVFYVPNDDTKILHDKIKDPKKVMITWGDHDTLPSGIPSYAD